MGFWCSKILNVSYAFIWPKLQQNINIVKYYNLKWLINICFFNVIYVKGLFQKHITPVEWMNEWCIYIALYYVLLYTQSALQSCVWGGGLLNHHQCSAFTWMMQWLPQDNGASAFTTHQLQVDKGQWWKFGQDTGVTHQLFTRSALGFLMTTEGQDLGLTSHPKDGACWQYSIPITIPGR